MAKKDTDKVRGLIKAVFDERGGKGTVLSFAEVYEAMGRQITREEAEASFETRMKPPTLEYLQGIQEKRNKELAAKGKADKAVPINAKWVKQANARIAEIDARNKAKKEETNTRERVSIGRKRQVSRCLSDMAIKKNSELRIVDKTVRGPERRFEALKTFAKVAGKIAPAPVAKPRKRRLATAS